MIKIITLNLEGGIIGVLRRETHHLRINLFKGVMRVVRVRIV